MMGSKRKGAPARRIASWGSAGEELVSEQVPRSRRGRSSALGLPRTLLEASNSRSNNLDFIRVVMASLVILTHAFDVFIETKLPEPLTFLTRGQLTSGAFAVGVFFLVSGYLVTASWRNSKSVFDFFRKRVLRVHPGFIVSCAICLLVVGPIAASDVGAYYSEISPLRFITDALLLEVVDMPPAFEAPYSVNGTLWMIQIEFLCYVLLGIIGGARLLNQGIVTLGIVVAWALMALPLFPAVFSRLPAQGTIAFLNSHFRFATFFFIGALGYLMRDRIPYRPSWAFGALAVFALGAATGTGYLLFPPAMAYLVAFVGFYPGLPIADFAKKRDLSYGIYLYGWPVQFILAAYLGRQMNPYLFSLISLLLACLAALGSWTFVEGPALRLKRRISPSAHQPAPDQVIESAPPVSWTEEEKLPAAADRR
ncbi:MAG: hypothetical protein B6A08_00150 [Sorangiineae bacterium NIC37A_2]|jgi:peptidoglycan/LPS O-acetylase OafA/YrhL|nr:MAG: hypothetical protein B6A08_00150 [Sorangiineae bacterium NIC37A_2]